jgi:hypothetical protein
MLLAACDTGLGPAEPLPPPDASFACREAASHDDFGWLADNVFHGCSLASSCHGSRGAGGLDLRAANAWDALVDRPAEGRPGSLRVAPFDPGASYLLAVLSENTPADRRMPPGGHLCPEMVDAIERWIAHGAPRD